MEFFHWLQLVAVQVLIVVVSVSLYGQMTEVTAEEIIVPGVQRNVEIATVKSDNSERTGEIHNPVKLERKKLLLLRANSQLVVDTKGNAVTCPSSPFVDCGSYSNISSSKITNINSDNSKSIISRRRRQKWSPVIISLINIPKWLARDLRSESKCSHKLCVFKDGDVTKETDIVAVHAKLLSDSDKPSRRWPGQLYLLINWEPPIKVESSLTSDSSSWKREFNLTMSYRLDADIFIPSQYLRFEPKPFEERPNYGDIFKSKSKWAVWFVSNCHTSSERERYVHEMMKYIPVDIYGACGQPAPCVYSMEDQPCLFDILKDYKFYLSFENSFCADYVTEKAFKIYTRDTYVIPVVRGALDYDKYFPANTFINAAHFPTAKDLAYYLQRLGSNLAEYSKYLEYKDMYDIALGGNKFCELCLALHNPMIRPEIYDVQKWIWHGCYYPRDLPEGPTVLHWVLFVLILVIESLFSCWLCRYVVNCQCRCVVSCYRLLSKLRPCQLCRRCRQILKSCF